MSQQLQQRLKELGSKLGTPPTSKDALIKLLKQCSASLSELEQSPSKSVTDSMQPLINAIANSELLKHKDQDVKLFVASCACEITRITAPEAPYEDDVLKNIFQLIVDSFGGLSDMGSASFLRRVVILETLARYRSCIMMLDLECDDLINEMFSTFFRVSRDDYPDNVSSSMETIMEVLLDESEDVPDDLTSIILAAADHDKKDVNMAAVQLAKNVIQKCAAKLEPNIKKFLLSSMRSDSKPPHPEISFHGVLYNVCSCVPQVVSEVVLYLTGELLSDQLNVRLKAVSLVGNLVSLPVSAFSEVVTPLFVEFWKRMADKAVEVRMRVIEHSKTCLLENPFRPEAHQIISALSERFLDDDETVRKLAICAFCDVACHSLTSVPVEIVKLLSERLQDKSLLVKRCALEKLADIHRESCIKHRRDARWNNEYSWIVAKILRCFFDKDFRSDAIEPVLSLSLYPAQSSVRDRVKNWVMVFSELEKDELKAFEKILEQKQRLQQEIQKYLSVRRLSQEDDSTEINKKAMVCFRMMSRCFADPAKTEENFQMLDQLKDPNIWKILVQLIDPNTGFLQANDLRNDLLKTVSEKHQLSEFLGVLSVKCSHILFDKNCIREILLEAGDQKSSGNNDLIWSCMTILVILARFCPSFLLGVEADLVHLLEDDNEIIREGTLHILAKAGGTIREQLGVSSGSLDLILESKCIEGSRRQAKYAVHALASIMKDDGLMSLSVLYKRLVDMLDERSHLPSVLQSLGCIAQAAMPVYETREIETEVDGETVCWDDRSELCSLKIYGVKTLVKSFLPVKDAHLRSGIDGIIDILRNILLFGDISRDIMSSLVDKAHLKLAAAKAVLRLSKQWEHKIPVDVFYLTLRTSEDKFPEVKKLLLNKVHQYIVDQNLDVKYASAFLLGIASSETDMEEGKRYLSDIIQQAREQQTPFPADAVLPPVHPESILIYVVHSIAHHPAFPNIDECKDVKTYEPIYRQLYTLLSMLINVDGEGKTHLSSRKDKESISLLNSIFLSIKHSEDAFDTAKSRNSYALCDLGMAILKRLAPIQGEVQNLSPSVTLPPMHYREACQQEDNLPQVDEKRTWLANEDVLAHFESIEMESNATVHSAISEDDIAKGSETEASEMPLGKLMKRLKAEAIKMKKEAKNEATNAQVGNNMEIDVMRMVKEITNDIGTPSKFQWSNGHRNTRKRSSMEVHKNEKLKSDSKSPLTKRRKEVKPVKSSSTPVSKGSKGNIEAPKDSSVFDYDGSDEEPQPAPEDQKIEKEVPETLESESLFSRIRKKISSSKLKEKRASRDHGNANSAPEAKKPKKISNSGSGSLASRSDTGSMRKGSSKIAGLEKCTTKENGRPSEDIVGRKIQVWWPMDERYYEGTVKSFDVDKKKHVILYDDGDVEVLRLDKENWKLVGEKPKPKQARTPESVHHSEGSSGQKRSSTGGSKQIKKTKEGSSSQVKGKRTPRKGTNEAENKVKQSKGSGEIPDAATDPEKQQKKEVLKSQANAEKKQEKGIKKVSSKAAEKEEDSEDTETDNNINSPSNTHESDNVVSALEKKPNSNKLEESGQEADEGSELKASSIENVAPEKHAISADPELSDNEPLSLWKQRSSKK